jgi:glycosyltransferase involved in cell wall biosynthesis
VTVVVPCKGHAPELGRCLESLAHQAVGFLYETVVVDSASDARVASVVARFVDVRLLRSSANLRAGAARNQGVSVSRAEYIAFIDADCRAEKTWLAAAVDELRRGAVMVGGPVLDALPWHPVAVADNLLQFADFRSGRQDGPARYFPACNMAVKRAAFMEVDGFPEVHVRAGEDTALCDRFLRRWPDGLRFVRGMRVRHDGRTGFGELLRHQATFGHARAVLGLHMSETHRRWGARAVMLPAVIAKRLSYIAGRSVRWDAAGVPRLALLLPLLLAGLCAWAAGFRRGCREAAPLAGHARTATSPGRVGT